MPRYFLCSEEWYPVYEIWELGENDDSPGDKISEVLVQRWNACMQEFESLQKELKKLYDNKCSD